MSANINKDVLSSETKAREWFENLLWPDGPICPHCGLVDCSTKLNGTAHRPGVYKCKGCEKQFTVTVGTLFERSKIPLNKWLMALFLLASSKKGMSTHQMHRMLDVSYKSTWFMTMRLREAMRDGKLGPLGGQNKVVEADETYVGGKESNKHKAKRQRGMQGRGSKEAVFALVERGGKMRSHHIPEVSAKTLKPILHAQIDRKSYLMTDDSTVYPKLGEVFAGHGTVNHSIEEYVRGHFWHTNTVENYFSILKRGIVGTYHHVSQQHLKRYLGEFDFRYNERVALGVNDWTRAERLAKGITGKRLTYRRTRKQQADEAGRA